MASKREILWVDAEPLCDAAQLRPARTLDLGHVGKRRGKTRKRGGRDLQAVSDADGDGGRSKFADDDRARKGKFPFAHNSSLSQEVEGANEMPSFSQNRW